VDAQTFDVVAPASLDFIVHAHVIEHLFDPFGSIREALARLKPGGILLMAVPDMRHTFDKWRAPTMFDHLLADMKDGGAGTKLAAYLEHIRDVHPHLAEPIPDDQHEAEARRIMAAGFDVHVHAWTMETLQEHIARLAPEFGFTVEACLFVVNETIVALRKR
jgi:2-polyprenyl-3-methyl-5-hydroxy-6-metoxy-1,4-benzoquinol methylase